MVYKLRSMYVSLIFTVPQLLITVATFNVSLFMNRNSYMYLVFKCRRKKHTEKTCRKATVTVIENYESLEPPSKFKI